MLLNALRVLEEALRQHLLPGTINRNRAPLVHISPPGRDRAEAHTAGNALCLCLVGLEREPHAVGSVPQDTEPGVMPLYVNLNVLLFADFADYAEALFFLSEGIVCFQNRNSFTPEDFPQIDFPGQSLRLDPVFTPPEQSAALWQQLGSPLLPSLQYKVRMLRFQRERRQKEATGAGVLSGFLWWKKNK